MIRCWSLVAVLTTAALTTPALTGCADGEPAPRSVGVPRDGTDDDLGALRETGDAAPPVGDAAGARAGAGSTGPEAGPRLLDARGEDDATPADAARRSDGGPLDGATRNDAQPIVDAAPAPDVGVPPEATYVVEIFIANDCTMRVSPDRVAIPRGQTGYLTFQNRSVDYEVDVWLSYGGGYVDLATRARWDDPIGHCAGPRRPRSESADISTACSEVVLSIDCL